MDLNLALKTLRLYHNRSQKEIAETTGISASLISLLESDKREVTLFTVKEYAKAFSIPVSSIMGLAEGLSSTVEMPFIVEPVFKMIEWQRGLENE